MSRSRLARDSNFQNCRDRDLHETQISKIVEIEICARLIICKLSRSRFGRDHNFQGCRDWDLSRLAKNCRDRDFSETLVDLCYAMLQDISKSSGQKFVFQNCLKSTWNSVNIALEGVFMKLNTKFYKKKYFWQLRGLTVIYPLSFKNSISEQKIHKTAISQITKQNWKK